jgi:3-hexulose-6-phosphate synthase
MKIQLSLDFIELEDAFSLSDRISHMIDIIEFGTPFLINYGAPVMRLFRDKYENILLADSKIIDGGYKESLKLFDYGADIVTALSHSSYKTLEGVSNASKEKNKGFMIDFIQDEITEEKIKEFERLNPEYFCVHSSNDLKNTRNPYNDLKKIKKVNTLVKIAVAGGLNLVNLPNIIELVPDLLIIGGTITSSNDPADVINKIKGLIEDGNKESKKRNLGRNK